MNDTAPKFASLDDLRAFVHQTLCARENLLPEQSRFYEVALMRAGEDCGRQFFVHGPRLVQLSAIWASDQKLLYFYDTKGERFLKLRVDNPVPAGEASAA